MPDERDLLDVLKFELEFLEKGGYGRSPRAAWRVPRIFEDSPSCLNYSLPEKIHPCCECALMELVPEQHRDKAVPCDHIPLNGAGETVDTLYKYATQAETEEVMKEWLRGTIRRIEEERNPVAPAKEARAAQPAPTFRCANPICPENFLTRGGGRFFRFHAELRAPEPRNTHGVKHYWLCSHCSLVFTLADDPGHGPVIKLRWKGLAEGAHSRALPVA